MEGYVVEVGDDLVDGYWRCTEVETGESAKSMVEKPGRMV